MRRKMTVRYTHCGQTYDNLLPIIHRIIDYCCTYIRDLDGDRPRSVDNILHMLIDHQHDPAMISAISEDIGMGDVTSYMVMSPDGRGRWDRTGRDLRRKKAKN